MLAIAVSFAFRFLYNLVGVLAARLPRRRCASPSRVAAFFSGFIIPVRFFPDWLQTLAYATPFPSMLQLPVDVFVGATTGAELVATLAMQVGWAARAPRRLPTRCSREERESWSCRVAESLALYVRLVSARVRAQWQYRTSFALDVVGVFLVTFLDFIAILVIFDNVPQLGGWSVQEVALLYGIAGVAFSLTELAVGHLDLLPQLIRDGNFDLVLVRPRRLAAPGDRLRLPSASVRKAPSVDRWCSCTRVVALDIGWTAGRVAMIVVAVLAGAAHLRGHLGRRGSPSSSGPSKDASR